MQYIVPEYWNSWLLPYGEALLLKHLLLIPVLLLAFLNSFVLKREGNPLKWVKAESILVALIFIVTGFMGQEAPPHDVSETIQAEGASPLILSILQGNLNPNLNVTLHFNLLTALLLALAIMFTLMIIASFKRKMNPTFFIVTSVMWVLSVFLAVLFSIQLA